MFTFSNRTFFLVLASALTLSACSKKVEKVQGVRVVTAPLNSAPDAGELAKIGETVPSNSHHVWLKKDFWIGMVF